MLNRQECVERSLQWLAIAQRGYENNCALGLAANMYARPAVAATLAQTYATLAITASVEPESTEDLAG